MAVSHLRVPVKLRQRLRSFTLEALLHLSERYLIIVHFPINDLPLGWSVAVVVSSSLLKGSSSSSSLFAPRRQALATAAPFVALFDDLLKEVRQAF